MMEKTTGKEEQGEKRARRKECEEIEENKESREEKESKEIGEKERIRVKDKERESKIWRICVTSHLSGSRGYWLEMDTDDHCLRNALRFGGGSASVVEGKGPRGQIDSLLTCHNEKKRMARLGDQIGYILCR